MVVIETDERQHRYDDLIREVPYLENPNDAYDEIAAIGKQIVIFEERDWRHDRQYQCAQYVFGKRFGHPWAKKGKKIPGRLWADGITFLEENGFSVADDPHPGDIVGYAEKIGDSRIPRYLFHHFGIMTTEGDVISKWNEGHVFIHPLTEIAPSMGDHVGFFRQATYAA